KLKLSIIGCGRLGKTLAALFVKTELVCIQDIVNLSISSSEKAVAFIGQGRVCQTLKQFEAADIYLIATPDDSIELIAQQLAMEGQIFLIEKKDKPLYHAASVFASNYLVTLSAMAKNCYSKAGLNDKLAEDFTLALMSQALEKVRRLQPKDALTGPLQRADIDT